jgi:hypothetical protein
MSAKKHPIRRYLLSTLVGVVVGLVGVIARYEYFYFGIWKNDFVTSNV